MKDVTRERLVLPLLIPLGAFAVIGILTIGFSRILLRVPPEVATAIAIAVAVNILVAGGIVAARKRFTQSQFLVLTGSSVLPIILGGAVAVGIVGVTGEDHATEELPKIEIVAANLAFQPTNLEAEAGKRLTIEFTNNDQGIPHNVAIFAGTDASSPNVFRGQTFSGVSTVDYSIPALETGSYFFHCDVHPTMTGTLVVSGGETKPEQSPTPTAPEQVTPQSAQGEVTAKNIAFTPQALQFSSGTPIVLDFHNEDAGIPHNIAIFKGTRASGQPVFGGEIFAGVRTVAYRISSLAEGEYFFHCDVHPNMTGSIRVS